MVRACLYQVALRLYFLIWRRLGCLFGCDLDVRILERKVDLQSPHGDALRVLVGPQPVTGGWEGASANCDPIPQTAVLCQRASGHGRGLSAARIVVNLSALVERIFIGRPQLLVLRLAPVALALLPPPAGLPAAVRTGASPFATASVRPVQAMVASRQPQHRLLRHVVGLCYSIVWRACVFKALKITNMQQCYTCTSASYRKMWVLPDPVGSSTATYRARSSNVMSWRAG